METKLRKNLIIILMTLIIVITCLTFLPSLNNGYTNWDDAELFLTNPDVQGLSWRNIAAVFSSSYVGTYIPLTMFSFALEYQFSGQMFNPRVSHAINLALHLFNTLLVFFLFYQISQNPAIAFIVSILFALHPLHVESVAWATERKDMLYSVFYLSSLISYFLFLKRSNPRFWILTHAFFLLSILSKPMAITLPFVLLLLNYVKKRKFTADVFIEKLPLFVLSAVFLIINIFAQGTLSGALLKFPANIFVASRNIVFYLNKLFVPFKLSVFYPYPDNINKVVSLPLDYLLAPLAIIGFGTMLWLLSARKTAQRTIFGGLFFAVTVLPVTQLVPLVGDAIASDRYMYIPSLGIFFLIALVFTWLYDRLKQNFKLIYLNVISIMFILVIASLSVLSFNRCHVWKGSITLWNNVLAQFPGDPIALNNRGKAYSDLKQYDKAISDYDQALEADSTLAMAYFNRGIARFQQADTVLYKLALVDFDRAIALKPNIAYFYEQRGYVYQRMQKTEEALADYSRALELDPDFAQVYNDRGIIYFNSGDLEKALTDYNRALKIDPEFATVYMNRGDLRFVQGTYFDAIDDYSRSIGLDNTYSDAYYNRGVAYGRTGQYELALSDYNRAIALDPRKAAAYHNRGNIYLNAGEFERALADYDKALGLDTLYTTAYFYRGMAEYRLGMPEQALKDILKAKSLGFPVPPEVVEEIKKRK